MKWSTVNRAIPILWGLLVFCLIVQRYYASWVILALGGIFFASPLLSQKPPIKWQKSHLLLLLPIGLLALFGTDALFRSDHPRAWSDFEQKLSLFAMPLLWVFMRQPLKETGQRLFVWMWAGILTSSILMILGSTINAFSGAGVPAFFYDQFTAETGISPIYFAFFITLAVAWPEQLLPPSITRQRRHILDGISVVLLMLCASKLFVVIGLGLLAHRILLKERVRFRWQHIVVASGILAVLAVPVALRVHDALSVDLEMLDDPKYSKGTYFGGVTLRLLQLRFGYEILSENDAWLTGVGQVYAQEKLNEKYAELDMWMGDDASGDLGYRAYNYHNQWMESMVAVGLLGPLLLAILFIVLFRNANQSELFTSIVVVLFLFTFTESYLEREQGIVTLSLIAAMILRPEER